MSLLSLTFRAEQPICCPQRPVVGNILQTGFVIPTTAVQGAVLWRLRERAGKDAAEACFQDDQFFAWPLTPIPDDAESTGSILTPTTLRMSKYAPPDAPGSFSDTSIGVANTAGHRRVSGVLVTSGASAVEFWDQSMMTRVLTTHGVPDDPHSETGRNLYSVETMAPMIWRGLLSIPEDGASHLLESLEEDDFVTFGKRRTIQGGGTLAIRTLDEADGTSSILGNHRRDQSISLIAQSPWPLGASSTDAPFHEQLKDSAQRWATDAGLGTITKASGTPDFLFGWTRHEGRGLQQARRVAGAGAVITFQEPQDPATLERALRQGSTPDDPASRSTRQLGLGRWRIHPGLPSNARSVDMADDANDSSGMTARRAPPTSGAGAIQAAVNVASGWSKSLVAPISASQLARLVNEAALDATGSGWKPRVQTYIETQVNDRSNKYGKTWENASRDLKTIIEASRSRDDFVRGMRVLADLAVSGSR